MSGHSGGSDDRQSFAAVACSGGQQMDECTNCGAAVEDELLCPECETPRSGKNRVTAGVLSLVLGSFGAHKFYLGRPVLGLYYFLLFWTLLPAMLGIMEAAIYLLATDEEFEYAYADGSILGKYY